MNKTMNYNDKNFQDATVAVMNDIFASNANGDSMDDLYNTACKYVKMTREQFEEMYKKAQAKLQSWKDDGSLEGKNCELNEEDLDMVVGGSIGSFFSTIGEGIKTAACAVGNFVKEHAVEIGIVVGMAVLTAGIGAAIGAFAGAAAASLPAYAGLSQAAAMAAGAKGMAITFGVLGGLAGIGMAANY